MELEKILEKLADKSEAERVEWLDAYTDLYIALAQYRAVSDMMRLQIQVTMYFAGSDAHAVHVLDQATTFCAEADKEVRQHRKELGLPED